MRTRRAVGPLTTAIAAVLIGSPAYADSPQDPDTTGQQNADWGQVASNTAQLDTEHSIAPDGSDANGGALGQHSRSTQAADINGGFAAEGNEFGIEFNTRTGDETNNGRDGVGNVSRDPDGPHQTEPGDGGNGVHAVNNAEAAAILDPVTGDLTTTAGGTAPDSSAELLEGTSADNG